MRHLGFTLIELLIVIGILIVLFTITLVAINPARQFSSANDTKRRNDVRSILSAVTQYAADNAGIYPTSIGTTPQTIRKSGGIDLCSTLVPAYIPALPTDPNASGGEAITDCASQYNTMYEVVRVTSGNRTQITISAPQTEQSATISASL